jgi:asparagine synthase (glutamine-hydrolysing)
VLLAAVEEWGIPAAIEHANGMFAAALWDRATRTLTLVRDRIGEKPLYYGWAGDQFVFGSELKALRAHPSFSTRVDADAVAAYLRWAHVPAPLSIYSQARKLPPGTFLSVPAGTAPGTWPAPVPYWRVEDAVARGMADPFRGGKAAAVAKLDGLLRDAVSLRVGADVPVGAFLSGGIDSSTVVALMREVSRQPVHTFTVTMPDAGLDEGAEAAAVAAHLGTVHESVELSPADALGVVPQLATIYDEPFGDPSQLPTFLVARVARRHVTVALSGDGGDEVFGGYNRHVLSRYAWRRMRRIPAPMRSMAARAIRAVPARAWDLAFDPSRRFVPTALRVRNPADKATKLATLLQVARAEDVYPTLVGLWEDGVTVAGAGAGTETTLASRRQSLPVPLGMTEEMLYLDSAGPLPDGMLTKVDRASMAVALEVRLPLLDHRVVELAWRLPLDHKIQGNRGKWILRQVLHRYVPPALVDRPKIGFDFPVGAWLRGPLRPWAEELLDPRQLADGGWLDGPGVRQLWAAHLEGPRDWGHQLWAVLMLQAWLRPV